jgi:hypothetical protein
MITMVNGQPTTHFPPTFHPLSTHCSPIFPPIYPPSVCQLEAAAAAQKAAVAEDDAYVYDCDGAATPLPICHLYSSPPVLPPTFYPLVAAAAAAQRAAVAEDASVYNYDGMARNYLLPLPPSPPSSDPLFSHWRHPATLCPTLALPCSSLPG